MDIESDSYLAFEPKADGSNAKMPFIVFAQNAVRSAENKERLYEVIMSEMVGSSEKMFGH